MHDHWLYCANNDAACYDCDPTGTWRTVKPDPDFLLMLHCVLPFKSYKASTLTLWSCQLVGPNLAICVGWNSLNLKMLKTLLRDRCYGYDQSDRCDIVYNGVSHNQHNHLCQMWYWSVPWFRLSALGSIATSNIESHNYGHSHSCMLLLCNRWYGFNELLRR